ncbi:MAG: hypothetical protein JSR81_12250, partial [Proteobacteria bacterium]|nr:hypothetical protein [Pseudomonadota bacterium]
MPRDVQAELARARELYYKGIKGDKNALRESDRLFARLHSAAPDRPVVQAYYGSLRLLEAGRTWALWRKNALSREGLQHLDQAVERSPGDLEVRFLRAATTYHLPGF